MAIQSSMAETKNKVRRYDLDWLRVLVFGLLIIFHIAIGFDEVGIAVYGYGNNQLGGTWLSLFILFTHEWRLPLLFLIAGMGNSANGPAEDGWRLDIQYDLTGDIMGSAKLL